VNRIDRLSAILIQLQSKKIVKAQEIADRFEISLRTVYRDIRALEEAGIPIGAEAGVGYFLNSDFNLPPVMFTREEASSFLLAGKLVGKLSDAKVAGNFESALFKIKSVLKGSEQDYLDILTDKIEVYSRDYLTNKQQHLFLHEIQQALASKKVLKIGYKANYNQQFTERIIEPVSLCNYDMNWHLIAYCRLRNDYRDFRLDRIESVEMTNQTYDSSGHISLQEYFDKMFKDTSLHQIHLKVHQSMASRLGSSKYWFGMIEEKEEGEYHFLKFSNSDLRFFAKWILSMEDKVEILSPKELKGIVEEEVRKLCKYYK